MIRSIILNILLFIVTFTVYVATSFYSGFGANDGYASNAWALFIISMAMHFAIFTLIMKRKNSLQSTEYAVGLVTMIVVYAAVLIYYNS